MLFAPQTDQTVEYISIHDTAVDDKAMGPEAVQKYLETRDRSLLVLKGTPHVWTVSPLSHYEREYVIHAVPKGPSGDPVFDLLYYHACEAGLRGVDPLPEGAPPFEVQKSGAMTKVVPAFFSGIPPEMATEIGYLIWTLSTLTPEAKKK